MGSRAERRGAPHTNAPGHGENARERVHAEELKSGGGHKVKLLLAVSHTCSVTRGVNPARALIPQRCVSAAAVRTSVRLCVCACTH